MRDISQFPDPTGGERIRDEVAVSHRPFAALDRRPATIHRFSQELFHNVETRIVSQSHVRVRIDVHDFKRFLQHASPQHTPPMKPDILVPGANMTGNGM